MFTPIQSVTAVHGDSGKLDEMIKIVQQLIQMRNQQAEDEWQRRVRGRQMSEWGEQDADSAVARQQLINVYGDRVTPLMARGLPLTTVANMARRQLFDEVAPQLPGMTQSELMKFAPQLGNDLVQQMMPSTKDYVSEEEKVARLSGWLYQTNPKTLAVFQRAATDIGLDPTKHYQMWNIYAKARGLEEKAKADVGEAKAGKPEVLTAAEANAQWLANYFDEMGFDASKLDLVTKENAQDYNASKEQLERLRANVRDVQKTIDMNVYNRVKSITPHTEKGNNAGYKVIFKPNDITAYVYHDGEKKVVDIRNKNGDKLPKNSPAYNELYPILSLQDIGNWYQFKTRTQQERVAAEKEYNRLQRKQIDATGLYKS